MTGGTFIDDGDGPGAWADALRLPPWLADSDGQTWFNLAFVSPAVPLQGILQAAQGSGQRLPALTRDVLSSLHDIPNNHERKDDHGA